MEEENIKSSAVNIYESKQDAFKLEYIQSLFTAQTENLRAWDGFVSLFLGVVSLLWVVVLFKLDFFVNQHLVTKPLLFSFAAASLFCFLWKYYLIMLSSSLICMEKIREVIKIKAEAFFMDIQNLQKENPVLEAAQIIKAEDLKNLFISLHPSPTRGWVQKKLKHSDPLIGYRLIGRYAQACQLYMTLTITFFLSTLFFFVDGLIGVLF